MLDRDDDTRASVVEELSAQDRLDNPPRPAPRHPRLTNQEKRNELRILRAEQRDAAKNKEKEAA